MTSQEERELVDAMRRTTAENQQKIIALAHAIHARNRRNEITGSFVTVTEHEYVTRGGIHQPEGLRLVSNERL